MSRSLVDQSDASHQFVADIIFSGTPSLSSAGLTEEKEALLEELAVVKGFKDNLVEEFEAAKKQFAQDQEQLMHTSTSKFQMNHVFSSPGGNEDTSGGGEGNSFDVSVDEVWVKNVAFTRDPPAAMSTPFGQKLKLVVILRYMK